MAKKTQSAKAKGNSLEEAVRILEAAILRESPSYADRAFQFEPNKLITVDGVRHEIDLWVTVDHGSGYTAIFIFECKNWKKKIGKSHIIEFSEKVKVAPAQKGFFVAKSFTRYAKAQAAKDPRIELLRVEELDVTEVPSSIQALLKSFHILAVVGAKVHIRPHLKSISDPGRSFMGRVEFVIDDVPHSWDEYVSAFVQETVNTSCNKFDSLNAPDGGTFPVTFEGARSFDGHTCFVNGEPLDFIKVFGTVQVHVARPSVIESQFEIASRGRVYNVISKSPYIQIKANIPQSMTFIHLEQIHRDVNDEREWKIENPLRLFLWLVGQK